MTTPDERVLAEFTVRFRRAWNEEEDGAGCLDPIYEELDTMSAQTVLNEQLAFYARCASEGAIKVQARDGSVVATVPASAVGPLRLQTGLTRQQVKWGLSLAVAWRFIRPSTLQRWLDNVVSPLEVEEDDDPLLQLDELLLLVGAGDIADRVEFLSFMTEED